MIKITGSVLAIIPVAFKPVGLRVLSSAYTLDGNGQHIFPGGTSGPLPGIAESHSPSLAEHCTCQGLAGCLLLLRSSHPVPGPCLITRSASVLGSYPGLNNCKITMTLIGSLATVWRAPALFFNSAQSFKGRMAELGHNLSSQRLPCLEQTWTRDRSLH